MYLKALNDYVDAIKEADDFDLTHMEEPYVMLFIENPEPQEGSKIVLAPGLEGTVFSSIVEADETSKKVTTIAKVTCAEIEKFMNNVGLKIEPAEKVINERIKEKFH